MIYGWPEDSCYREDVTAKMDPSLRIIAPDMRGLGHSERAMDQDPYQKKMELVKDIVAIADTLGIDSFNLVGHDWGDIVAQEVAIAIPDRVNQFVIMNIHYIFFDGGLGMSGSRPYVPFYF